MVSYHEALCGMVRDENEKYKSFNEQFDLSKMLAEMECYLVDLRKVQKEMANLSEQSRDLRRRADALRILRQKEDEKFADEMERIKLMEQSLKPVEPSSKT